MIDEQLEFRLTQYLDGSLPTDEAVALFEELAKNPAALATLDEYRKLDLLLRAEPAGVKWDALAEQISGHIDEETARPMRIGWGSRLKTLLPYREGASDGGDRIAPPARLRLRGSFPIKPGLPMRAAMVLLAVGVATWLTLRPTISTGPDDRPIGPVAVIDIAGPAAESTPGVAVVTIEIGPSEDAIDQGRTDFYAEFAIRPPRVIIASGVNDRQDERLLPY